MAHRTDKLNNYLVVCHLGERYPHHIQWVCELAKGSRSQFILSNYDRWYSPYEPCNENNSRELQACMNIALILKHKAWQNTFCSLPSLPVKRMHQEHMREHTRVSRKWNFSIFYSSSSSLALEHFFRRQSSLVGMAFVCSYMTFIILDFYRFFYWCAFIVAASETRSWTKLIDAKYW